MTTENKDVIRKEFATQTGSPSPLKNGMDGYFLDTLRMCHKFSDGTLRVFASMTEYASQTGSTGSVLIGVGGITDVQPAGGDPGDAANLQNMLQGFKNYIDAVVAAGGIVQIVDFSAADTFSINSDTSVLVNIGEAATDIELDLPVPTEYTGAELVIMSGEMGGFKLTIAPGGEKINGSTDPIIFPQRLGNYLYMRLRVIPDDDLGWEIIGQTPVLTQVIQLGPDDNNTVSVDTDVYVYEQEVTVARTLTLPLAADFGARTLLITTKVKINVLGSAEFLPSGGDLIYPDGSGPWILQPWPTQPFVSYAALHCDGISKWYIGANSGIAVGS